MECTVDWLADSGGPFVAETGSGHLLTMDGAPGRRRCATSPREPMETVLAGSGAAAAYDVVLILRRGRHAVTGCRVQVSAERASTDPKVFTRMRTHFVITGQQLDAQAVARAVALSHEKYCSATAMLAKTAQIEAPAM